MFCFILSSWFLLKRNEVFFITEVLYVNEKQVWNEKHADLFLSTYFLLVHLDVKKWK